MIDTRTKIVTTDEARRLASESHVRSARTYCDPMLPQHVDDLRALAAHGKLLLIIDTPADHYLDARARCEIAASLDFVAAVTAGDAPFAKSMNAFDATVKEREHRARFMATVRQKSGS